MVDAALAHIPFERIYAIPFGIVIVFPIIYPGFPDFFCVAVAILIVTFTCISLPYFIETAVGVGI